MKFGLPTLLALALIGAGRAEEPRTVVVRGVGGVGYSEVIELVAGESAELVGAGGSIHCVLELTIASLTFAHKTLNFPASFNADPVLNPLKIAGPAQVRLRAEANESGFAVLSIHRVSNPTTPAAIPAEPGQNFAVVMESSSDLVTWTPAAPGSYAGTEPKRFFRVRIDRE